MILLDQKVLQNGTNVVYLNGQKILILWLLKCIKVYWLNTIKLSFTYVLLSKIDGFVKFCPSCETQKNSNVQTMLTMIVHM